MCSFYYGYRLSPTIGFAEHLGSAGHTLSNSDIKYQKFKTTSIISNWWCIPKILNSADEAKLVFLELLSIILKIKMSFCLYFGNYTTLWKNENWISGVHRNQSLVNIYKILVVMKSESLF